MQPKAVPTNVLTVRGPQPALSIQHLERILGDRMFVDMMGGRQPRLVAAMKSLPLREDDMPANSAPAERDLVALLSHECSTQLKGERMVLAAVRKVLSACPPTA